MSTYQPGVQTTATLVKASRSAYSQKWSFLALFVFILFVTIVIAAALDLLPDPQTSVAEAPAAVTTTSTVPLVAISAPELPSKIEIPAIGLTQSVSNPDTTDVEKLDQALLVGPARYPSSSKLGEAGNVIIFAHSSYLPIVNNKAYKAFDGIQKLKAGDRITVTGENHTFVYAVQSVEKKSAIDDSIPLTADGSMLTLATCDSFGTKSDRFVVTAKLIETNAL